MYTGLGQQPPTMVLTNPDGSETYYFGPPELILEYFPEAETATILSAEEQAAIVAASTGAAPMTTGPGTALPGWVLPVAIGVVAFLLVRK